MNISNSFKTGMFSLADWQNNIAAMTVIK